MSVTLLLSGSGADGHTVTADGATSLQDLKNSIASIVAISGDDFEMLHDGSELSDMSDVVSRVGLCEGDTVMIQTSRHFEAKMLLSDLGLECTHEHLMSSVLESDSVAGTDEEKAGIVQLMIDCDGQFPTAEGPDGVTALHMAASVGNITVAKVLLSNGADVNQADDDGLTPLHCVSTGYVNERYNVVDMARLLVEHGADANQKDEEGWAPIHHAACAGLRDIIDVLLEGGADINSTTSEGETVMHLTALSGGDMSSCVDHAATMRFLISRGADIGSRTLENMTPMHYAATRGHLAAITLLIAAGSEIDTMDIEGRTPMHEAALRGYANVVEILRMHGSQADIGERLLEGISVEPVLVC
eukprot:TRINITY_DN9345_c0_g1_i1.p1 TRINITY_DN9345_c0_g1~~TRINITY_DN9345_c0_g1_i1.p1  ORF type:complete len:372 (+),score=103.37 TRINITY_DN9345_c0_g1_i1:42-1118(+)